MDKKQIALLNGTVTTTNGIYEIRDIEVEDAKKLLSNNGYISAIGHSATAEILSEVLETKVLFNRIDFIQEVGQIAIVFKLNKRPEEGVILDKGQIKDIGYKLKKMVRLS